jgi:putative transposase
VLKAIKSRKTISVMAALTISPKTRRHNLLFQSLIEANFDSTRVILFLRDLLIQLRGPVVVVWDNAPIHKSQDVKAFVAQNPRLTIHRLPPYAPDLNPVEALWSYLKYGCLANLIVADLAELDDDIANILIETKFDQNKLQSFWKATPFGSMIYGNESM